MSEKFSRTLGIVGGIGPAATAYAFSRLIGICQTEYGAVQDDEFPDVIVANLPLADLSETGFDESVNSPDELRAQLARSYGTMTRAGVDVVYMACNTLHGYRPELEESGLEEVNLIEEAISHLARQNPDASVCVLSSRSTRRNKLFQSVIEEQGMKFVDVEEIDQRRLDYLIRMAMGGQNLPANRNELIQHCKHMLQAADYVILGCTEFSLLMDQKVIEKNGVVDAQEVALRQLLAKGA